jgi:hypothetical protein
MKLKKYQDLISYRVLQKLSYQNKELQNQFIKELNNIIDNYSSRFKYINDLRDINHKWQDKLKNIPYLANCVNQ